MNFTNACSYHNSTPSFIWIRKKKYSMNREKWIQNNKETLVGYLLFHFLYLL
ncbi:hypothetical protein BACSTE_02392 [Bacteroides stercoris ATCC 43183]|uniref:Uncharacterized protein n=1 Tax=Bacteroides stercoris ATCC 43183 TaxID=449673 RepID=B0NSC8_BACSE|nr:hypothetical protein BACSTE_02392 [Bacteroides stercoris ATCC 43183]